MNKKTILNLKADRATDAMIAEMVFGFEFVADNGESIFYTDAMEGSSVLPYYTTNISDAWDVVTEVLKLEGVDFSLYADKDGWFANYGYGDSAFGDTPSLAICRGALLAVNTFFEVQK